MSTKDVARFFAVILGIVLGMWLLDVPYSHDIISVKIRHALGVAVLVFVGAFGKGK